MSQSVQLRLYEHYCDRFEEGGMDAGRARAAALIAVNRHGIVLTEADVRAAEQHVAGNAVQAQLAEAYAAHGMPATAARLAASGRPGATGETPPREAVAVSATRTTETARRLVEVTGQVEQIARQALRKPPAEARQYALQMRDSARLRGGDRNAVDFLTHFVEAMRTRGLAQGVTR
ncbi:hypothetical protein RB614_40470 [Phytohabitans sp. ZYX-F-186]|uniref:Uncharacterized protein n=1 Tax=Phytohabitans maris TaxID=3071409 RepID=A0ABU0ZUS2_9ACTN|nr:hypothetical protein [Phytohabitans sp. ZYX-F-186]MDQ7910785.1 hypothetical protein [Phytohabitans sp. ZYX-F-186]